MRKLSTCLLVGLLAGAALAGCGGSSNSTTQTVTSSQGAGAGSSANTGSTNPRAIKQNVELCKHDIQAVSSLSAAARAKLAQGCEKAGANPTGQRKIVHEVCLALAQQLPAGVARQRAEGICRRAP